MPRSALSNRQRKAQRRAAPKPSRVSAAPKLTVVGDAPMSIASSVEHEERRRQSAALAIAAQDGEAIGACGPLDLRAALAAEFGVSREGGPALPGRPHRMRSADGLVALHRSGALTAVQVKAGLTYRLAYEACGISLASFLGRAGEGRGGRSWGDMPFYLNDEGEVAICAGAIDLHRAHLMVQLNRMERAVAAVLTDGRELRALCLIAGEGKSVREAAGCGGKTAMAYRAALIRALDAIVAALRIGEQ